MKTSLMLLACLALVSCEADVRTTPEGDKTTVVTPPAEKKVEHNTTVVTPPAEKK